MFVLARCVFLIFIHDITMTSDGVCYEKRKVNGKDVISEKCCNDFYKSSDGTCSECPDGSFGENCRFKCIAPFYGRRCVSLCECKSCHYIYGCGPNRVFTTESSNYKDTTKEWKNEVNLSETTKEEKKEFILIEITKGWNKEVTSTNYEKDDKESAVTLDQVIIIIAASSASTAVSMIIVCICVLILRRLLCTKHRTDRVRTFNAVPATNSEINAQPSTLQEQLVIVNTNDISDSQYETIDESNMVEISNITIGEERSAIRNTHISSSSTDSKTSNVSGVASEDTEGYLHPYNTLEENWQNKGYQYTSCIAKANKK
ncbi:uncharacterized protein LOC127698295 [Mytilus californianus]|uniref:uncharacterized protein LOC127698295 n=1 Tax=Mytilus californianus TaxID=6549 RepID=UPI0022462AC1|nr:uncharacterized protein LOC127698295 [Mytilus californianus]